jgi:hypothetical protein
MIVLIAPTIDISVALTDTIASLPTQVRLRTASSGHATSKARRRRCVSCARRGQRGARRGQRGARRGQRGARGGAEARNKDHSKPTLARW